MKSSGIILNMGLLGKAAHNSLFAALEVYGLRVNGLDCIDYDKGALFAVKHRSRLDLPHVIRALEHENPLVIATKLGVLSSNWFTSLLGYTATPVNNGFGGTRALVEALQQGRWVVYTPEAKRVYSSVAENLSVTLIAAARRHNVVSYVVGIDYPSAFPWLPFPVTINIERLKNGNNDEETAENLRGKLASLSGLEQKLATRNH